MARSKLTDAEREELIRLYRDTTKTAPRLAEDFGISVSTVARIIKTVIPEAEYALLTQAKRRGSPETAVEVTEPAPGAEEVEEAPVAELVAPTVEVEPTSAPEPEPIPLVERIEPSVIYAEPPQSFFQVQPLYQPDEPEPVFEPEPIFEPEPPPLEILPYTRMELPEICYVVVDRWAELITRPLREFSFLDNIPTQEADALALPVFDSHRWAKRFSNRFQRILRVPTRLLDVTRPYLMNRGITRLLVGRQVFTLARELDAGPIVRRSAMALEDLPPLGDSHLDDAEFEALDDFDETDDKFEDGDDDDGSDNF